MGQKKQYTNLNIEREKMHCKKILTYGAYCDESADKIISLVYPEAARWRHDSRAYSHENTNYK